ncbi:MAG TPA: hypothetical protein VMZ53_32685 [Kofleriaceae bacterium]|nr:hypothetical protein [Kofleriaceae bacterium]
MIRASIVLLALLAGTAYAQPGATPSGDMPPPPPEQQQPPPYGPQGMPAPMPPDQPPPPQNDDALIDQAIGKLQAEMPTIETVARGTFNRARRAVAIGPTVGVWSAAYLTPGEFDAAFSVGLQLQTFKVPIVPDTETIKALIIERLKAVAKDRIKAAFQGRPIDPVSAEQIARQVYADVRAEVLGLANTRAKTLERPGYTVAFEADRRFGAERWLGRTRVGVGIWKLSFSLSASFGRACRGTDCDDRIRGFIGPEVTLHIIPKKNPRANVVDVFLRSDFQATGRAETTTYDQLVLGLRYQIDVI